MKRTLKRLSANIKPSTEGDDVEQAESASTTSLSPASSYELGRQQQHDEHLTRSTSRLSLDGKLSAIKLRLSKVTSTPSTTQPARSSATHPASARASFAASTAQRPTDLDSLHSNNSTTSSSSSTFVEAEEPKNRLLLQAESVPDLGQPQEIYLGDDEEAAAAVQAEVGAGRVVVDLSPQDRHYLNKALCHLQMAEEWAALSEIGELSKYPAPYLPHANGPRSRPDSKAKDKMPADVNRLSDAPFMSYLSWRLLFTFPGLRSNPDDQWHKLQAFFDSMAEHNLSTTSDRGEVTKRRVMAMAFNRLFATFGAMGVRSAGDSRPARMDEQLGTSIDDLYATASEADRALWVKAGEQVRDHRSNWRGWVKDLYLDGELDDTFDLIAEKPSTEDLPERYQKLINWACMWIAQLIYAIFVASDNAKEHLSLFGRIHRMIPYGLFRQSLRIASPAFLARTMVNVIFSEPFRQKSLFTRVCTSILSGDLKNKTAKLAELSKSLNDAQVYSILEKYVNAPLAQQEVVRRISGARREDIVLAVLRNGGVDQASLARWQGCCEAYQVALKKSDSAALDYEGDNPSQRYALLKVILKTLCEKRDREEISEVVLESNTPEVIKTIIAAFYDTVTSIASATKLSIHVTDLENFMGDVVKTCGKADCTRADTIRLVQRNAPSFYRFIHDLHSHDQDLMSGFIAWDRTAFDMMKDGVPTQTGRDDRFGISDEILASLSAERQQSVLAEIRQLTSWTRMHKAKEDIRRRIDFAQLADPAFDGEAVNLLTRLIDASPEFNALLSEQCARGISEPTDALEWIWYSSKAKAFSNIAPSGTATSGTAKPPVRLDNVRLLLPAYRAAISDSLKAAREAEIR